MKNLQQLASEALRAQDACNISGIAISFAEAIVNLRRLLESEPGFSTDALARHPITQAWVSKLDSLSGASYDCEHASLARTCFNICEDIAEGK